MTKIELAVINEEDLLDIWEISYGPKADLEWMKYNGPYFNDPIMNWEEFSSGFGKSLINDPLSKAILFNNKIVGLVTAYWEDGELKQWLDIGILREELLG